MCWCDSGKKRKRCHLDGPTAATPASTSVEDASGPFSIWDAAAELRKTYSAKYCSAPSPWLKGCASQIIRAHTIPRSASLSAIARDGHVYAFNGSLEKLEKNNGRLEPELVGLKQASTFTGFCGTHDNSIFDPLESGPFVATPEQCFLLGYRGFAREAFTKKAQYESLEIQRKAARNLHGMKRVMTERMIEAQEASVSIALRDHGVLKPILDGMLMASDFSDVRAYVIEFDAPPAVMCSGSINPEQDFNGAVLVDLADFKKVLEVVNVNCFYDGRAGFLVLSWLSAHDAPCKQLAESLDAVPDSQIGGALVRFMFEFFENVCISPDWWEALSSKQRSTLVDRFLLTTDMFEPRKAHCLADDSLGLPEWQVMSRRWLN